MIDVPIQYDRRPTRDACYVSKVGYVSGTCLAYGWMGGWVDGWVDRWMGGWDSVHDGMGTLT